MILLTVAAVGSAVLLAPPAAASPARGLSWLLFTGSSVHVASTGWLFSVPAVRAYGRKHLVRCLWIPCGLVVVTAAAAAAISPAAFAWLLLPYFGWQFFHYQKQNIGMAALAASAGQVQGLRPSERWPLLATGLSGIAALIVRPTLLGLRLGSAGHAAPVVLLLAAATFMVSAAAGMAALARRPRAQRPAGFSAAYLTALVFFVPAFAFASPYAAVGGLTIAHGLQYLLLLTLIAGGTPASPASTPSSAGSSGLSRLVRLALLANVAFVGGALLSGASHQHDAGPAGRLIFGAYLGIVMAHLVIDAGLWRMRDPLARNILITHLPYLVSAKPTTAPGLALVNAATDRSPADIQYRA
jgi:hypothetical protein